jgi:hypothetical protein
MWMLSPIPHEPLLKAEALSLKLRDTETYSQKPRIRKGPSGGGLPNGPCRP